MQALELTCDNTLDKSANDTSHQVMLNDIEEVINDTETSSGYLDSTPDVDNSHTSVSPPIKASRIWTSLVSESPFTTFA